jgi:hypothetical protein
MNKSIHYLSFIRTRDKLLTGIHIVANQIQ